MTTLFSHGYHVPAVCDDDPAIAPDSRFWFTADSDGDYIVEIRDAGYDGSPQHRYRLRIRETDTDEIPRPPIRRYSTTLPTTAEQEPNDEPTAATPFQFPAQLKGGFSKPHDRDIYQFTAKLDQHILVRSKPDSVVKLFLHQPTQIFRAVQATT